MFVYKSFLRAREGDKSTSIEMENVCIYERRFWYKTDSFYYAHE